MKDDNDILSQMKSLTAAWPVLPGGVRYTYLKDYFPINAYAGASLTEDEEADRKLVYDFGCKLLTTQEEHEDAVAEAVRLVSEFLTETFGEVVSRLTLVPIPASSAEATVSRYKTFCCEVSATTGIGNGYGLIRHPDGGEGISGSGLVYDREMAGKAPYCLLFDDLISTGKTMETVARDAAGLGCNVAGCLALGKVAKVDDNRKG